KKPVKSDRNCCFALETVLKTCSDTGSEPVSFPNGGCARMTKTELINMMAAETNSEKRQAKMFLEGLTAIVEKTIKKGGEVPMSGLGKFRVAKRKARMGRNPATGEPIKI